MFQFNLVAISPQKPGPLKQLCDEYQLRLRAFAKVVVKEPKAEPFANASDAERVFKAEAERLHKAVERGSFVVALTEGGKEFDSVAFAKQLETWSENESRPLAFVLGGPLGLDRDFIKEADATLSLSPMTMPHDLARLVLLEQLYRATTILRGKTYHY
jgi:23S rRNA (pseudouridine1915-N3)-methyltransferase